MSAVKGSSGLSVRRLAALADVAGSTVTRIQAGTVDPSVHTLKRIVEAAGFDLRLEVSHHGAPRPPRLGDLAGAWSRRKGRVRIDWTKWRTLIDALARHPELVPEAIYAPPPPAGDQIVDALLAAVAEKLADDAGLPRPVWTGPVPVLDPAYRPPVARTIAGQDIPQHLAARGLMIDTESLWRRAMTADV